MAKITISNAAPSNFFWAELQPPIDPALVITRSGTTFSFEFEPGSAYDGWTMTATGNGFKYLANTDGVPEPTDGLISAITIRDDANNVVLTINSFASAQRPELADVYARLFDTGSDSYPNMFDLFTSLTNYNDTITGSDHDDSIFSSRNLGNDTIDAGGGNDFVDGTAGNDSLNGGSGFDTLSYAESFFDPTALKGITLDVTAGTVADCWGGTDTFSNFETYQGSRFKDVMTGSATDGETFIGLRGNDIINGSGGTRDWAMYADDARYGGRRGIIVDLDDGSGANGNIQGTIRDGFGNTDTVINIERVKGTQFADTFVGSELNNTFVGNGGKDSFDGVGGSDRVAFWDNQWQGATAGVVVDLTRATGQIRNDGFGNVETALNIENVAGGNLDDTIKGNNNVYNFIEGNEGADTLAGGTGADGFGYYNLNHFGDSITDFQTGVDELYFAYLDGLATTPISFRVGNSVAADAGTTGAFYFKTSDLTLYYDQDGTGSAFTGVAVLTVQAGGSIAAGDLFLDF